MNEPIVPDVTHPVVLVLQRFVADSDESREWLASVIDAAPADLAWAFVGPAAESVVSVARAITRGDSA